MTEQVRVTREIGAPAEQVCALVCDVTRMGEWSPENVRRFSFRVGLKVAEWSYAFEPTADGCRVTESFIDQRAAWFKPLAHLATGVGDRAAHNRAGKEQTLERLAAAAESTAAPI